MHARIALLVTVFLGIPIVGCAADQFPGDTDFVGKAQQSGNQEIGDARVALAMSKDPLILAMAKRIQKDGSTAIQQLAALSVEKGWPSPNSVPPRTLRHYSDHRYVVRQIAAQRNALTFYGQEAAYGSDTALQEFARDQLPIIRRRLGSMGLLRTS